MTWTAPSSRSSARLRRRKTANRYRQGQKTPPPAKKDLSIEPRAAAAASAVAMWWWWQRLIPSAIAPVSLQATRATDVTRA